MLDFHQPSPSKKKKSYEIVWFRLFHDASSKYVLVRHVKNGKANVKAASVMTSILKIFIFSLLYLLYGSIHSLTISICFKVFFHM